MRFSQRHGHSRVFQELSPDSISDELRSQIWNITINAIPSLTSSPFSPENPNDSNHKRIWADFLHRPVHNFPYNLHDFTRELYDWYEGCQWYECYDLAEFVVELLPDWTEDFNKVFEKYNSAYRMIGGEVVPVTEREAVASLERSLASPLKSIRGHINEAASLLSDRQATDFRNSVKESVSAVEAACRYVAGDESGTLGRCIKIMSTKRGLHPALAEAVNKLYGWASDSSGIRHSLAESDIPVDRATAKLVLVICSSISNYIIENNAK